MKKSLFVLCLGLAVLAAGCKDRTPQSATGNNQAAPQAFGQSGVVVETMNSGGYTYVQVDTGQEKIWVAAPEFAVQVGDPVVVPEGMAMTNHHSKTLDRTFETIYFVDAVMVGGAQPTTMAGGMPPGHPQVNSRPAPEQVDLAGIKKAQGGKTVEELYAGRDNLSGKEIVLRGKVVKFSPQIMGKNWLHVQDGTGGAGTNDLTVTTDATAKVGDTVLVTGVLIKDKDFGHGYRYDLIVENAKVVVEN